jgi:hypothetical protein
VISKSPQPASDLVNYPIPENLPDSEFSIRAERWRSFAERINPTHFAREYQRIVNLLKFAKTRKSS